MHRKVIPVPEADFDSLVTLIGNAYPGLKLNTADSIRSFKERMLKTLADDSGSRIYGVYEEEQLLGTMRLYDFQMNLFGVSLLAGGVGMVAVDMLHKKEKVAKDLVDSYLRHYVDKGAAMALLYPFRTDFYKKMGFGMGTKMSKYRIPPGNFPKGAGKTHLFFAKPDDSGEIAACYQRFMRTINGLIERSREEFSRMVEHPDHRTVCFRKDGMVLGYMVYTFKNVNEENMMQNDLIIKEWVYETPEALQEMCSFLHSQSDQINRVVFHTQDEYFHFLFDDPRNETYRVLPHVYLESNTQGVGVMYRILSVKRFFQQVAHHSFGGQSLTLTLRVRDTFLMENHGSLTIRFEEGYPAIADDAAGDVVMEVDIAELSSLVMGAITLKGLLKHGLVTLSDMAYANQLHQLFLTPEKPMCMTAF